MAATWDPAFKGANITLSGGNLVATTTSTAASATFATVGYLGNSGRLLYFEVTASTVVTAGNTWGIGIAVTTDSLATFTGGAGGRSAAFYQNGKVFNNTTSGTTYFTFVSGAVIGVAVDFAHGKLWFTNNGTTWNNAAIGSQNPATNTGGYATFAATPWTSGFTVVPSFGVIGSTGNVATANFGATTFAYSVPSGFQAWDFTAVTTAQARAMVLA